MSGVSGKGPFCIQADAAVLRPGISLAQLAATIWNAFRALGEGNCSLCDSPGVFRSVVDNHRWVAYGGL